MEETRTPSPDENEVAIPAPGRPVLIELRKSGLERSAAQAGALAGHTVGLLRDIRKRFEEPGQAHDDRLSELGATARARTRATVDEVRRKAGEHAEKWRQAALEKTAELRRQARDRYEQTRSRANQVARDYPVHVLLAAGVAGFLLGAALRTWRANRAG